MARLTDYDFKICKKICERVTEGLNIKQALAEDKNYPSFPTWCKWKRENAELLNLYVNSIQDKADSVDSKIDDVWNDCRNGLIDASTANVLIQTLKWKAAKYYPKMFGEKVDFTTQGEKINSKVDLSHLTTDQIKELLKNEDTPTITD